ncbi:MAG: sugar transferase [Pedosphaera sp.]|nr:sugar transferase [Pedosphaera sp.]
MLRRHRQIRMQIHQLMDACLFAGAFWLAYEIRASDLGTELFKTSVQPFTEYVWFYMLLIPAAPLVLESQGFYDRAMLGLRQATLWPLFKGCAFLTLGLVFVLFFVRFPAARGVMIMFGFISFLLVWAKEEAFRFVYRGKISQPHYQRRVLLVGPAEETARIGAQVKAHPELNATVVGQFDLNSTPLPELVNALHDHSVSAVIVSARHTYFEQVEAVISACEVEGVEAWLVADFFRTAISRMSFDDFYGQPVMVFCSVPETSWRLLVKQTIDYLGALLAVIVLAIPMGIVAILIKFTSPGPVLFRQMRSGLNGSPFTIYKFRTMVTNAEQLKHELEAMNEMRGPVFKVSADPRITAVGKWLRRFSIDELPQFFNVLRGEMSLVGPRPLPVDEVRRFNDPAHRRRLSVRPGITCLWQVSGRSEITDFHDWVRLDLEYIDHWSLWLDFKILLRTLPAVLRTTGAK